MKKSWYEMMQQDTELIVRKLNALRPYLSEKYGVSRIAIFGSYAKGRPSERSDLDLLVEFERPIGLEFNELVEYLEKELGLKVDILTPVGLQGIRVPHVAKDIARALIDVCYENRMIAGC